MRQTFLAVVILLLFSTAALAQRLDTTRQNSFAPQEYNRYWKQRNTFNTLGWIMLGAGVGMCSTSYLVYAGNDFNGPWDLEPLFVAGLVSAGSSLPLFVAASVNKRKARLALKGEKVLFKSSLFDSRYPAIAFRITL